jgi:hypothetical protein
MTQRIRVLLWRTCHACNIADTHAISQNAHETYQPGIKNDTGANYIYPVANCQMQVGFTIQREYLPHPHFWTLQVSMINYLIPINVIYIYIHHILLYSHIYRDVVQCCTLSRGANNMHVYILCAHTTVLSTSISASVYVYIHYMTTGIAACSSLQILYFIGFDPYPYTYIYKNTTDIHKI